MDKRMTLVKLIAVCLTIVTAPAYAAGKVELESAEIDPGNVNSLQRGARNFMNYCSGCHSAKYVRYKTIGDALGLSEQQLIDNLMFNAEKTFETINISMRRDDSERWFGVVPPDMSLLAKARAPERGFPTFIFDVFMMYAENGPDYIYSLLTGYQDPPEDTEVQEGLHYNPYFVSGNALAMANPLSDGIVSYDDGSPETVDQYSKDISAFLMWASEPGLQDRKQRGFIVIIFLLVTIAVVSFSGARSSANRTRSVLRSPANAPMSPNAG